MRAGLAAFAIVMAGAGALVACAAVLGVADVAYGPDAAPGDAGPGDAPSDGATSGDAGSNEASATDAARSDASIACQSGPCNAATQSCCVTWGSGLPDMCVDGKAATCTLDGSATTSVFLCDDPSDCLAFDPAEPVCCLHTNAPSPGESTSECLPSIEACTAGAGSFVMCNRHDPNACAGVGSGRLTCASYLNNYDACQ